MAGTGKELRTLDHVWGASVATSTGKSSRCDALECCIQQFNRRRCLKCLPIPRNCSAPLSLLLGHVALLLWCPGCRRGFAGFQSAGHIAAAHTVVHPWSSAGCGESIGGGVHACLHRHLACCHSTGAHCCWWPSNMFGIKKALPSSLTR